MSNLPSLSSTVDGVLGGYGTGTLPRIDALGSRTFLLRTLSHLANVPPASAEEDPVEWREGRMRVRAAGGAGAGGKASGSGGAKAKAVTRALDCGAGVGRVSENSLLPILDEVHLVEPVEKFLREAKRLSKSWKSLSLAPESQPFNARKAAHFHCSTLQDFDPARPYSSSASIEGLPTVSPGLESENEMETKDEGAGAEAEVDAEADAGACAREPGLRAEPVRYDVVWCQWCLQHLSDADLISFLKRAKAALVSHPSPSPSPPAQTRVAGENENEREQVREPERYRDQGGVIVVKENVCQEEEDGSERVWYDDEDHSITRSTNAYERVFREAGLSVVRCEVQHGLPEELFVVKMWALR